MHRRRLLALCGSFLAGAGCTSLGGDTAPETDTVTPIPDEDIESATPTDAPTEFGTVEIASVAVQPGVVGPDSPDSIGVFDDAGQYLVVTVDAEQPAPSTDSFAFRFDGDTQTPTEFVNGLYRNGSWSVRYADGRGPLVFELAETGDASDARLSWPGGEWTPPQAVRERLEAPLPAFSATLDGPQTVTKGDEPRLTVTVTNEGERAGRFAFALNQSGPRIAYAPVASISGTLAAGGETIREFAAASPYLASPPREATYLLDGPGTRSDTHLTISPAETKTEQQ